MERKKRTILITNDDGIEADGIIRLAETAVKFGEVWVVAPDGQRSAASHSLTLHTAIDVRPHDFPVEGVRAFSCTGMPPDCVRVGCYLMMPREPDVVLSGINHGLNAASDIQYSATAGAAFEASLQGYPGIALSEDVCGCHETSDAYLEEVLERLLDRKAIPWQIYNVNFPGCPLSECRGILENRAVSRKLTYRDHYRKETDLENGGIRLRVEGIRQEEAEDGTDYRALLDHYISIGTVQNIG